MRRADLISEVSARLGRRRLVWAGLRGEDIESIADLPQLASAYSIIGAYDRRSTVEGVALEHQLGRRVDPEVWDIDDFRGDPSVVSFRRSLLQALSEPSALLPYRPSNFLSAIWFARRDRCMHLGLFGAQQFAFEHKPWVETAVEGLGVPTIPWVYIADEEQLRAGELVSEGPILLRRSRTSGGQGFFRANSVEEASKFWPETDEAFVSVAPYYSDVLPINVGAVVWNDGVSVHHPSVQLIGIEGCVTRPFGYCGNDFALARDFDLDLLSRIEDYTVRVGQWLRSKGYLGAFGVDYLLDKSGVLRFTEVNPRFQGSTVASARLSVECGHPCLVLEHLAAQLGVPLPRQRSLSERMRETAPLSQLILHWTGKEPIRIDIEDFLGGLIESGANVDVCARPDFEVDSGATLARVTVRTSVTNTGFSLTEPMEHEVRSSLESLTSHLARGGRND
ncbi:hypothetical protein KAK07_11835 [Ideonella sp. 4Y16]|uniref:hypothetical protein n=1 Tax=Ideonella alba TaxID=2824118 RepID=UPI001B37C5EA|nr:hypothetical protein [Ideonella alba]MBQ0944025.1 hypothetical protein [Ideonella alba]